MSWIKGYQYDNKNVEIIYISSQHKERIFKETHEGFTYRGEGSFRAFNLVSEKKIYIFVDESENDMSLLWLTFHELTHTAIFDENILAYYFAHKRDDFLPSVGLTVEQYFNDESVQLLDEVHENLPEEKFCNDVATRIVGEDYSRSWWRKRRKGIGMVM